MPHTAAMRIPHLASPWLRGFVAGAAALLVAAAPATGQVCNQLQASGNPEYPPYLWRDPDNDERLVGANAELMQWLSREIGVPIELRYGGPWGRVQEDARLGHLDLVAGAFFTTPRTEFMDYVHPPFHETRSVIWTRSDTRVVYRQRADLARSHGVTVINNSFGEDFDRFAREKLRIHQVATLGQAIQMVQSGRADYLVYEDFPGQAFLARRGISDVKMLGDPVAREPLYLTLSHRSDCNTPEMRGRLARALYKLGRDKTLMDGFVERGIQAWRRQDTKASPARADAP
jgi:polar amino acid transport system substrate-binding protein